MKGRLNQSKMEQGSAFTTLTHTKKMEASAQSSATAESAVPSKKTILLDKSNSCDSDTPTRKSSKTSALDSISKEKDCKPYWSDLCAQISSRLLLPVETDCVDSDLKFLSSWQNKTVEKSWFSQILFTAQNPNPDKIQHLVKELHHKTAKFLVDNFDVILLPSFESSQMVSKSRRKIRSKTARQMLTLSHYQFKKHLEWKAWEQGKVALTSINEAYTSKTISWTGEVKKIGGSRTIKDSDGNQMNRDLNGARGIFTVEASVDTPWLSSNLNLCIC